MATSYAPPSSPDSQEGKESLSKEEMLALAAHLGHKESQDTMAKAGKTDSEPFPNKIDDPDKQWEKALLGLEKWGAEPAARAALAAARLLLERYENEKGGIEYTDKAPRNAIEIAERYLVTPIEESAPLVPQVEEAINLAGKAEDKARDEKDPTTENVAIAAFDAARCVLSAVHAKDLKAQGTEDQALGETHQTTRYADSTISSANNAKIDILKAIKEELLSWALGEDPIVNRLEPRIELVGSDEELGIDMPNKFVRDLLKDLEDEEEPRIELAESDEEMGIKKPLSDDEEDL